MLAYAGIELKDMAKQLGLSEDTMSRHAGDRSDYAKKPNLGYLTAIAHATGVPMDFFYIDFARLREITPQDAPVIERRGASELPDLRLPRAAKRRAPGAQ